MHRRHRILHRPASPLNASLFASVLFVLACEPKAQTEPPAAPPAEPAVDPAAQELEARLAYLEQRLEQARVEGHVPGMAIAIVKDDALIYAHGFGVSDLDANTPVTPETTFAIGSSTKAFSSTLAAMMVDEGKLGWDDPVTEHLPELVLQIDAKDGEQATVRDLLSHRSGFARMGILWAANTLSREQVLGYASKAEPVAPFRAEFHYNNVTYLAGSMAAARVAGMSWEQLVTTRLLEPLGMSHSNVDYASAQDDPNYAKGYTWRDDLGKFEPAPMRNIDIIGPAGSINSSVLDMSHWLRLQLGEGEFEGQRLVSAEALAETRSKQIELAPGVEYGMGWFLRDWDGHAVVEHGGNIDGFAASVALMPDEQLGMVLLANTMLTPLQGTAMNMVWDALLTDAYLPVDPGAGEDFGALVGEYVSTIPGMNDNFSVEVKDGKLAVDVPGQTLYTLEPPDEDGWRYFEATNEIAVSFDLSDTGEVIALRLHQSGMSFELLREGVVLPPEVDEAEVRELLGSYRAEDGMTATVRIDNGRLAIDMPGQMTYALELPDEQGDYHFRVNYDFLATFEPGKSLTIIQPGTTTTFTREASASDAPAAAITLEQLHKKRKSTKRQKAFAKAGVLHWKQEVQLVNAGASGTISRWTDPAGQSREETSFGPLGEGMSVVTGEGGWSESSFEPAKALQGVELLQSRLGAPQAVFGDWREYYDSETLMHTTEREGVEVHVVEVRKEGLPARELYIDGKTWDVIEIHAVELAANGIRIPTTSTLSDYRTVAGLRVPFRVESTNPHTGTTAVTLVELERKVDEDPQRFVLPEAKK